MGEEIERRLQLQEQGSMPPDEIAADPFMRDPIAGAIERFAAAIQTLQGVDCWRHNSPECRNDIATINLDNQFRWKELTGE